MDNTSVHGQTEVKKQHEEILQEEYNVIIEWQVPCSSELNLLDLGEWMSLQSYIETIHCGKVMQSDELANSVKLAFDGISKEVLVNVYKQWKMVLQLTVSGKGTNEIVEKHRWSLTKDLSNLPSVPDSDDEGEMKGLLQVSDVWDDNKNILNGNREEFDD